MTEQMNKLETRKIYQGHVLEKLKLIPNESVHLTITSPPYWGLRDYSTSKTFETKEEADSWSSKLAMEWTELTNSPNVEFVANPSRYDEKTENWVGSVSPLCVWDGLEDCEHEWGVWTIALGSKSDSNKEKNKFNREDWTPSSFCIKCNAWKGQLGLEPDFNTYIDHLMQIFDECKRVLTKDGSLWVVISDTYYGGGNASGHTANTKNFGLSTIARGMVTKPVARGKQLKSKTLVGIPARFQIAMIDRGWICRNNIIWHKVNAMPESVKDRFTRDFENFFFFTKSGKYFFEQQFEKMNNDEDEYRRELRKGKTYDSKAGQNYPYSKYNNKEQESTHRQGMHSERGDNMIKKRMVPNQKKFVDYMRSAIYVEDFIYAAQKGEVTLEVIKKWIANDLEIPISTVEHWFRYDDTGFAFPSIEDWRKFQETYAVDDFDGLIHYWEEPDTIETNPLGRNARTTWSINTKPFKDAHFAVFPEELIEIPIKSCCPKDGVVLDPFMGSGTVAVVAKKMKLDWFGIELNPEYIEIAEKRIADTAVYHDLEEFF